MTPVAEDFNAKMRAVVDGMSFNRIVSGDEVWDELLAQVLANTKQMFLISFIADHLKSMDFDPKEAAAIAGPLALALLDNGLIVDEVKD